MLYKYLISDRIDVLNRRRIRFTQPIALNDPFELQPYFESLIDMDLVLNHIGTEPIDITPHLAEAYEKLDPHLKSLMSLNDFLRVVKTYLETEEGRLYFQDIMGWIVGIFENVARIATPRIREQWRESFGKRIGILSLSEIPNSPLMWAHYAQQHAGFVIGFNEKHEFFDRRRSVTDEFYHLRQVTYREPTSYSSMLELDGEKVFLVKSPDWRYEREWRIMAPLADATEVIDATDPISLFEFPPSAIRVVVSGARASESFSEQLRTALNHPDYQHVHLTQAVLDLRTGAVLVDDVT